MLNHIVLMGRLTRDPELRRTGSGLPVASFTLAVDRDFSSNKETGQKETDFIDIVAWRSTAEFVSKYFSKGRMAVVSGRLQIRTWNDKEGNKRYNAEVVAENVYFGDSKRDGESSYHAGGYGAPAPNAGGYAAPGGYGAPAAPGGYGAPAAPGYNPAPIYPAPATPPVSDFAMLEDDDAQLPF